MGRGVDADVRPDEDVAADIDTPRIKRGEVAIDEAEVSDVDVQSVVKEDGWHEVAAFAYRTEERADNLAGFFVLVGAQGVVSLDEVLCSQSLLVDLGVDGAEV